MPISLFTRKTTTYFIDGREYYNDTYHSLNTVHALIHEDALEAFKAFLETKSNPSEYLVEAGGGENLTPLELAYNKNQFDFVDVILQYPVGAHNSYGKLLHTLLLKNSSSAYDQALIKSLIDLGASNYYYNNTTVLHLMVMSDKPDYLEAFLKESSIETLINESRTVDRKTVIQQAAILGKTRCLDAFITVKNKDGNTYLNHLLNIKENKVDGDISTLLHHYFDSQKSIPEELFLKLTSPVPLPEENKLFIEKFFPGLGSEKPELIISAIIENKLKEKTLLSKDAIFLIKLTEYKVKLEDIQDNNGHTFLHQLVYPLKAKNLPAIERLINSNCISINSRNSSGDTILDCYIKSPELKELQNTKFLLSLVLPAIFKEILSQEKYDHAYLCEISKMLMPKEPIEFRNMAFDALKKVIKDLKEEKGPQQAENIIKVLESALNDEVFKQRGTFGSIFRPKENSSRQKWIDNELNRWRKPAPVPASQSSL